MSNQFEASKPIYIQIAEKVYQQIVRHEIKPGDKLPSVREMAILLEVNPNTIQRSYSEMERMGIVETRRGQGTFVVEREEIVMELKNQLQDNMIDHFVKKMKELGLSNQEIMAGLESFLKKGENIDN